MEKLNNLIRTLERAGGKCYIVGGYIRDQILGIESKDIDVEVFGLTEMRLGELLSEFGAKQVGRSFPVWLWEGIDISIPRRERKVSDGYTGFEIEADPFMDPKEAASRRDFTINSVMRDSEGTLVDSYGGINDTMFKILKPVSERFREDPLRVLRGFQFAARLGFDVDDTFELYARELDSEYHSLSRDRIWVEWAKWAKGNHPALALSVLERTWINHYPTLYRMQGVPQEFKWHPEGDVWVHTKHVCQSMANICVREGIEGVDRTVLMLSALLHDSGKYECTFFGEASDKNRVDWRSAKVLLAERQLSHKTPGRNNAWRSPGHDMKSGENAMYFLGMIGCPHGIIDRVKELCELHMRNIGDISPKSVRKLKAKLKYNDISTLTFLMEADQVGRPPLVPSLENTLKIRELGKIERIECLITGEDLIARGFTEGREIGIEKKRLFDMQLDQGLDRNQLLNLISDERKTT